MEAVRCTGCEERDAELARLREQLAVQAAELAALRTRLDALTKRLPKRPPEPPKPTAAANSTTTEATPQRKPGGQPGHPPHLKQLLPRERVQQVVPLVPTTCRHCQHPLPNEAQADDPAPTRHQVAELPPQLVEITEYEVQARTCGHCGRITKAELPAEVRRSTVGVRLAGFFAYLVGRQHLSKRGVEELSEEVLGAPIALGTVANLEQEMSAALAAAHAEAMKAVRGAPVKHLDETGWKQGGCKRWLWVAATSQVAVFLIHQLRNVTVLYRLLGETMIGVLVSDRLHAYGHVPLKQRQLCWAHVKRNFEKLLEWGGKAQELGEALLKIEKKVFELWHWRVKGFCTRLGAVQAALWTFVKIPGVEPTNNHAERLQRPAVIWRKCCYGCSSAAGCDFVARLLTVVHTLRLQQRPVLDFLAKALQAHRAHQTPPPLLATA